MSEMQERLFRAIADVLAEKIPNDRSAIDAVKAVPAIISAALAALREPTDEMKAVVAGLFGSVERWQLMIDAALKPPTNSPP